MLQSRSAQLDIVARLSRRCDTVLTSNRTILSLAYTDTTTEMIDTVHYGQIS